MVAFKNIQNILNNQSIKHIIKAPQKHLRNLEKLTLRIERLKRERELKSTKSGRKFHAFTIRSLKRAMLYYYYYINHNSWYWIVVMSYNISNADSETLCGFVVLFSRSQAEILKFFLDSVTSRARCLHHAIAFPTSLDTDERSVPEYHSVYTYHIL